MKKILRLVTTSVLTLTLVACGEASSSVSSSVSSSTPASSSVSSVSSAFANVTSVTLSAATDGLTQTLGAQKRVTVTAALNANTNPNLSLEWFVNGTKSNQTGRVFEYVPTEAGAFAIQARVGNVSSNTLTVNVGLPVFSVQKVEWQSASQILVTAPGGATVAVAGNELLPTSFYDLAKGQYVINLKTAFTQGQTGTITLAREGQTTFTQSITYDTRELKVGSLTAGITGSLVAVTAGADGVYSIVKPFEANTSSVTYAKQYKILLSENIRTTAPVEFKVETTVPAGATAIAPVINLVTTASGNLEALFTVSNTTVAGLYTHKITLGAKVLEVKVDVKNPVQEIVFKKQGENDLTYDTVGVKAGADGVFEVTRPFETITATKAVRFDFNALNFAKPEFVTNQYSLSVTGPSTFSATPGTLFAGIETKATLTPTNLSRLKTLEPFNGDVATTGSSLNTSATDSFVQVIDSGTPLGLYTFTVTAGTTGNNVTREVRVRVVNPAPKLDFVLTNYFSSDTPSSLQRDFTVSNVGDVYTIEKPFNQAAGSARSLGFYFVLSNYQSGIATPEEIAADSLLTTGNNLFSTKTSSEGTGTGAAAANTSYRLVNLAVTTSGPQTGVLPASSTAKLPLLLANNTDAIIVDNVTGAAVTSLGSYSTSLVLDGRPVAHKPLISVSFSTVPGNYTYSVAVDGLVKQVTLRIVESSPMIFVLSTDAGKFNTSTPTLTVTGRAEQVKAVDGVYTVERYSTTTGFSANISVADLPLSTSGYSYRILKEYPSGLIEEFIDTVVPSAINTNQIATLPTTGVFGTNWKILESASAGTLALGTYRYTFEIGTQRLVVVVNVIEKPSISVTALKVGSTDAVLFNKSYRTLVISSATDITATYDTANFSKVVAYKVISNPGDTEALFTAASFTDITAANLGTLNLGSVSSLANASSHVFVVRLYSNKTGSVQIGEDLTITLRAETAVA